MPVSFQIDPEEIDRLVAGASLFAVMAPNVTLPNLADRQSPYEECLPLDFVVVKGRDVWGLTGGRSLDIGAGAPFGTETSFAYTNTAPIYALAQYPSRGECLRTGTVAVRVMHLAMYNDFAFRTHLDGDLLWASDSNADDDTGRVRAAIAAGVRLKAVLTLAGGLVVHAPVSIPYYRPESGLFDIRTVPEVLPLFTLDPQSLLNKIAEAYPALMNPDQMTDQSLNLLAPVTTSYFEVGSGGEYSDMAMSADGRTEPYTRFALYADRPTRMDARTDQ